MPDGRVFEAFILPTEEQVPNLNWDLSLYLGGRRTEHFLSDIRVYKAFILPTEEQVLLPSIRNGRTYMYLKSQITIVSSYYYS